MAMCVEPVRVWTKGPGNPGTWTNRACCKNAAVLVEFGDNSEPACLKHVTRKIIRAYETDPAAVITVRKPL